MHGHLFAEKQIKKRSALKSSAKYTSSTAVIIGHATLKGLPGKKVRWDLRVFREWLTFKHKAFCLMRAFEGETSQ